MKTLKILLVSVAISIFSCSSDDDNREIIPEQQEQNDPITGNELNGSISEDATLSSSVTYNLTGSFTVRNGATLTIEAGTRILAKSGRTDVFLAVERGAKLIAKGTAANPIIFTSDSESPRAGDWGGIVLAGRARSNKGVDLTGFRSLV
jgi:hypothetical protein